MQEQNHFNRQSSHSTNSSNSNSNSRNKLKFQPQNERSQSTKLSVDPNPLKIAPMGNKYFDDESSSIDIRNNGLGNLAILEDEVILSILGEFDFKDLLTLSLVSKSFWIFSQTDELWKEITINHFWDEESRLGRFTFQGSWYDTFVFEFTHHKFVKRSAHARKTLTANSKFKFYSDPLFNRWICNSVDPNVWAKRQNVDKRENLSMQDFVEYYETPHIPVILKGIVDKWPAFHEWTKEKLMRRCGDTVFKTDQGVHLKLNDYFAYSETVQEKSPMYLFDNQFADKVSGFSSEYEIPEYFQQDLFKLLQNRRPSYRWLLVGPTRSGASFHKDPNFTSAWNGLLSGRKKWILLPTDQVPPGVFPSEDEFDVTTPDSVVEWFIDFYGKLKNSGLHVWECITEPGDLLFIPSGCWHLAINLEESIAVTQNYVSERNLVSVLTFLKKKQNQELYTEFSKELELKHPSIYQNAVNEMERIQKENEQKQKKRKRTMWESLSESNKEPNNKESLSFSFF